MAPRTPQNPATDKDEMTAEKDVDLVEKWAVLTYSGQMYGHPHGEQKDAVSALKASALGGYLAKVYVPKTGDDGS